MIEKLWMWLLERLIYRWRVSSLSIARLLFLWRWLLVFRGLHFVLAWLMRFSFIFLESHLKFQRFSSSRLVKIDWGIKMWRCKPEDFVILEHQKRVAIERAASDDWRLTQLLKAINFVGASRKARRKELIYVIDFRVRFNCRVRDCVLRIGKQAVSSWSAKKEKWEIQMCKLNESL